MVLKVDLFDYFFGVAAGWTFKEFLFNVLPDGIHGFYEGIIAGSAFVVVCYTVVAVHDNFRKDGK